MWNQEVDLMSRVGPFQHKISYDSVKNHFLKALRSLLASFSCRQEQEQLLRHSYEPCSFVNDSIFH